ncbi:unnamed protein product, partial [Meganyctiphanes norvegica]|uniref:Cytoplasmic tRNA 2-thiolation protein 2 n=1 Tax=Meganyctiphanes norvegica TaxID=48144 RepID=A0AAV2RCI1_MEGNR
MCSVDPDEITEMIKDTEELDIKSGEILCRKCNEDIAEVVLRKKDPYCKKCFLKYFIHKFRATIGKSKMIFPNDRVLVSVSGGSSSMTLLHLLRGALDEDDHKKFRFVPYFLHIDECCLTDANAKCISLDICKHVSSKNFICYTVSIEQSMSSDPITPLQYSEQTKHIVSEDLKFKLQELFNSCSSSSAREDLLLQLRQDMISRCAESLGFTKVFVGDNATGLAVSLLSSVAQGRGAHLASKVHFKSLHGQTENYRPMRELLINEIDAYISINNISKFQTDNSGQGESIGQCTEKFVLGLQSEFPSTIPTIFRTGDKLASENKMDSESGSNDNCALCGRILDTDQGLASALHATVVSQQMSVSNRSTIRSNEAVTEVSSPEKAVANSSAMNGGCCGEGGCCGGGGGGCGTSGSKAPCLELTKPLVESCLCYGCRVILRELAEVDKLPSVVKKAALTQEKRKQMKNEIKDFLL